MPWFPGRCVTVHIAVSVHACHACALPCIGHVVVNYEWSSSKPNINHFIKCLPVESLWWNCYQTVGGNNSFQAAVLTTAGSDTPSQSPGCADHEKRSAPQLEAVIDGGLYNLEMPKICFQLVKSDNPKQRAIGIWISSPLVDFSGSSSYQKSTEKMNTDVCRQQVFIQTELRCIRKHDASIFFSSPEHMCIRLNKS